MYLTQAKEDIKDRIYVTIIKGQNVREEDWREATRKEKEEYERSMEEESIFFEEFV